MEGIEIELHETANGKRPFEIWIKDIKEIHTRAKILTRLDRLRLWKLRRLQNLTGRGLRA